MSNVIIVDVKGLVTQSNHDVVARHNAYGVALKLIEPNSKLYILSRREVHDKSFTQDIEIISANSLLQFLKRGRKLLRSLKGNTLMVSGDPWESFFTSKIIQSISRRKLPIQVQLHADVGSSDWRSQHWKNRLRSLTLAFSLNRATQVRCVTSRQLANLEKISPCASSRAVVIPVPIKIDPDWDFRRKSKKNCSIAIVGRIHKDRGLKEFVRVCTILAKDFPALRIIIVGEGPHEEWLRSALKDKGLLRHSSFTGFVNQQDLSLKWQNFGCVASFAPSEAYGRTVRESLIYGVPVLARRSTGLQELATSFERNGIWFLDNLSDNDICNLFRLVSEFIVDKEGSESIIRVNDSLNQELVKSWISCSTLPKMHNGL